MSANWRVLVVDDDLDITAMLKAGFAMHGHAAECAGSGQEALDLARSQAFDVAIIDLLLGRAFKGDDLAAALTGLAIPIIMTSGAIDAEERLAKLPYPYLRKPFHWAELLAVIDRTLADAR